MEKEIVSCGCDCCSQITLKDNEKEEQSKFSTKKIITVSIGILLFVGALAIPLPEIVKTVLFCIAYLFIAFDILIDVVKNIAKGDLFNEGFLMAISSVGALIIGERPEGVAVMLFYQVGEFFNDLALERSRKSIKSLVDIRPEKASGTEK